MAGPALTQTTTTQPKQKRTPVRKSRINSCDKGKRGERGCVELFREYGYDAHRGQQHAGGAGSPDVVQNIPGVHVEVKWVNGGNLYRWLEQAKRDAGALVPVVFHRMDRRDWVVIMRASDFLEKYAPKPEIQW
jgi:Holliday junction resolvase